MRKIKCVFIYGFTFLSLCLTFNNPLAKEAMNWSVIHWPPIMILEGPDQGKGRFDVYLELVKKHMPQYAHSTQKMNWKRIWQTMQKGENVCNVLSLKTAKREQFAYYSLPNSVTLPNRIIMKDETFEQLGKPESLSLVDLTKNPTLIGNIEASRSYTPAIDKILTDHQSGSNIQRVTINPVQLMKMLLVGRFDYLIEYPYTAHYLKTKNPQLSAQIKSVAIEEIKPYAVSYLTCTKNAWGKQRIEDYNKVLKKLRTTQQYREIMEMWYATDQEKKAVRAGFDAMLKMQ
jgi:uncharacterized protein (TIGR02285 family)